MQSKYKSTANMEYLRALQAYVERCKKENRVSSVNSDEGHAVRRRVRELIGDRPYERIQLEDSDFPDNLLRTSVSKHINDGDNIFTTVSKISGDFTKSVKAKAIKYVGK